jgi:hypothetical protein
VVQACSPGNSSVGPPSGGAPPSVELLAELGIKAGVVPVGGDGGDPAAFSELEQERVGQVVTLALVANPEEVLSLRSSDHDLGGHGALAPEHRLHCDGQVGKAMVSKPLQRMSPTRR